MYKKFLIPTAFLFNLTLTTVYTAAQPSQEKQDLVNYFGKPICFLDTQTKDPYFRILDTACDKIYIYKLGTVERLKSVKYHGVKSIQDLENLIPLKSVEFNYINNTKLEKKYPGEREAILGKILETIFLPKKPYTGKIILDEYLKQYPMFWSLKNIEEFRAISTYLLKNFHEENIAIPEQKPVLILRISDDLNLEQLDQADAEFLKTYFEVLPLTDKVIKNIEDQKKLLTQKIYDFISSKPKMIGESFIESVFRETEDLYKDFSGKRIGITITSFIVGGYILNEFKNISGIVNEKIFGKKSLAEAIGNQIYPAKEKPRDATNTDIINALKEGFKNLQQEVSDLHPHAPAA